MSGHSKWSTIKHKKAAIDAKKGKAFSRIAKELMNAARQGGKDPLMNPPLRSAILAAKSVNMPNDNIDRAIKKGAGELGGAVLEELGYEGFAPGGVGILVEIVTDNRNRTAADVRNLFTRNNGSLASSGSVARQFVRKVRFVIEGEHANEEKLTEMMLDAGVDVEDVTSTAEQVEITGPPEAFEAILKVLEKAKITAIEAGIVKVPTIEVPVNEVGIARQIIRLIEGLEEDESVQHVWSNEQFSDAVLEQLAAE